MNMKITLKDKIKSRFNSYKYHSFGIDNYFILETKRFLEKEHVDWSIRNANFDDLPYKGDGERVAVFDTGVDPNHSDLKGKVKAVDFINGNNYYDENGHGTFCIGQIIASSNGIGVVGVAPNATGLSGKVLYGNGKDNNIRRFERNLVNAINYAIEDNCGVISMSLGTSYKSALIESAVIKAVNNGIIVVAASGNEGMMGSPYKSYPASYTNVISVAASNKKGLAQWFSTSGIGGIKEEQPEVAISSLEYYWGCAPDNMYTRMIGTSMATPVVAGMALLWRQAMREKNKMPKGKEVLGEFRKWIQNVADDTNKNGWDSSIGYGSLILSEEEIENFV
jgi:subtilisin